MHLVGILHGFYCYLDGETGNIHVVKGKDGQKVIFVVPEKWRSASLGNTTRWKIIYKISLVIDKMLRDGVIPAIKRDTPWLAFIDKKELKQTGLSVRLPEELPTR